jgi:phosphatidylglycerol---prolipoprotein diacylglyceryl transferase
MFVNNIDPVLAQIGPVEIRYYGLVYTLGFLTAYLLLNQVARKKIIKNLDESRAEGLLIWLIIGVVAGARIFSFVFYTPHLLLNKPWEILFIWHGGMSFHGALAGSFLATYFYCRINRIKFYQVADFLVLPASVFLFLGRIANFINSELVGTIADPQKSPWCVVYKRVDEYCRHPSQLYEAAKNLLIFFTLMAIHASKKLKDGTLFWTFILLYGSLRFVVNFWRDDPTLFGISTGQAFSLAMIPVSTYFLYKIYKKP